MQSVKNVKGKPIISVITAVYNGAADLEKTIKSVISVAYDNLNFIVIDGGSSDGTLDIIRKYEHVISYWVSEKDNGVYDAMNKGWERADVDSHILYLGAGDEILQLPSVEVLQNQDIIYGNVRLANGEPYPVTADFRLKMGNTVHHQALMIRKRLHVSPPFNLEYKVYSDFDFNQRLLKSGGKFFYAREFQSAVIPAGISGRFMYKESLLIVFRNFGLFWAVSAGIYYILLQVKRFLLKPFSRN